MGYLKGLIRKEDVSVFVEHLILGGYNVRPTEAKYELMHIMIAGRWLAITIDGKGVVGLPEELSSHAQDFQRGTFEPKVAVITDTERLDFMLLKCRKVIVSIVGIGTRGRGFEVYVEEGFMSDREYTPVFVSSKEGSFLDLPDEAQYKRQAIDLAINESKEQTSEKSN